MTPPSPGRVVGSSPLFVPFPNGVIQINPALPADLENKLTENLLSSFKKFEPGTGDLKRLTALFDGGDFNLLFKFHKTVIPVNGAPDLKIAEGAGLCAGLRADKGKLSTSRPIFIGGVTALGGILDFCQIDEGPDGRIKMSECPCAWPYSRDITQQVMDSPLGVLFPDRKVQPVSWEDLTKIKIDGSSPGGLGSVLGTSLQEVTLKGKIPSDIWVDDPPGTPGGSCHPLWAGVELYLDVPVLKETIEKERYKQLDFSGVKEGSFMDWPRFDLSFLSLPEGIHIQEGRADLSLRYHPESKITEISLKNLKAQVVLSDLFGNEPVEIQGDLSVILKADGSIQLKMDRVQFQTEAIPSETQRAFSFSTLLTGDLLFGKDAEAGTSLQEAHLQFDEIALNTLENKGIKIEKIDIPFSGKVQGKLQVNFLRSREDEPLQLKGELQGSLKIPLGNTTLPLSASVSLNSRQENGKFQLRGDGEWKIESISPFLKLGSPLHFQTDLKTLHWTLPLTGDQRIGSLILRGEAEVQGEDGNFTIKTLKPFESELDGKKIAKGIRLSGKRTSHGTWLSVQIPSLLWKMGVSLGIGSTAGSDRLFGQFQITPRSVSLNSESSLQNISIQGRFHTPPIGELLEKPQIFLSAEAQGRVEGLVQGPVQANIKGSLSYSPEKKWFSLWINPKESSTLTVGPLAPQGELASLEGKAQLQGTWLFVPGKYGLQVGGSGVGIKNGTLTLSGSAIHPTDPTQKVTALSDLSLVADQLWNIHGGVAYGGGTGIKLDAKLHLNALQENLKPDGGDRHVVLIVDQLPLSLPGYWRLFKKMQKDTGGTP